MTHKFGVMTQKITHRKSSASLQQRAIKAVRGPFYFFYMYAAISRCCIHKCHPPLQPVKVLQCLRRA